MPHHVPLHDSWRPKDLAASLRDLGVQSDVSGDRVIAVIPILEFLGPDKILAATTLDELKPKKLGETNATLSFCGETLIDNILIQFDIDFSSSLERHPDHSSLRKALEKCGYICGSESEIVYLYLPDDSAASELIDEIESLQLQKEDRVANEDFGGAKAILQKQQVLRTKLEDKIRNLPRPNGG